MSYTVPVISCLLFPISRSRKSNWKRGIITHIKRTTVQVLARNGRLVERNRHENKGFAKKNRVNQQTQPFIKPTSSSASNMQPASSPTQTAYDYFDYFDDVGSPGPASETVRTTRRRHVSSKKVRNAADWANILPALKVAYIKCVGQGVPRPEASEPAPTVVCGCSAKSEKDVVCVFRCCKCISSVQYRSGISCGADMKTIAIQYCDVCPGRSLPVILLERHMFPVSPTLPSVALHVEVMRTIENLRFVCRASITAIAQWAALEYKQEVHRIFTQNALLCAYRIHRSRRA